MKQKKTGFIGWAMRYHNITNILVVVFVLIGVVALLKMPRNEFPNFTIRQGLVIGVYPGASSAEVEEQLTKQVENYIFGFKEVKKAKTYSESKEGMMIIYVELNDNVTNADEFWSKLKHGLNEFKSSLPSGVIALMANSDFGDTSAMLITLSSNTKGYKDMENELKKLKAECRKIPAVSKIKDYGIQKEKIYVNVEPEKLNEYNIKSLSLLSSYQFNGMVSPAGKLKTPENDLYVHFPANFESEKDLSDQIVFADPTGGVVRLKDIAKIERKDEEPDNYIRQEGKKTILLSLEMQQGNNIVDFGKDVQVALDAFKKNCPKDIEVNVISNLPQYVNDSVSDFMREFLIAIIAVILVVMLLLPKKVAAIAGITVPIAILITLGFLYFFGVELNTVSLAGLIVVLGMIVDNSIVVIDNYIERKDQGMSSWHAAIKSARELVTPIITATMAICIVYIPLGSMLPGTSGDFVRPLPLTICIALVVSVVVALFVVPFLNFHFIKKGLKSADENTDKKSFLDKMQAGFDVALDATFRHPKVTMGVAVGSIVLAVVLFLKIDQRLFPELERNQFAVEVYLDKGSSLEATSKVVSSLENTLKKDKRVSTVTSFIGSSSPRFHTLYAPHIPSPNYGQLMVNTVDNEATRAICEEYSKKTAGAYPNAHIKWKILAMQINKYPIELRISGDSIKDLRKVEAQIDSIIKPVKGITWVYPDWEQKQLNVQVDLDKDKANRMGYSKGLVATSLLMSLNGIPLTTIWENDYPVSVELKQEKGEKKDIDYLGNQTVTSPMSFSSVPLRSFAKFTPEWTEGTIVHRNGTRTLTIQLDVDSKVMASNILAEIKPKIDKLDLPKGVSVGYGGDYEGQTEVFLPMGLALAISIAFIFFILLFQFKKVKLASLIMSTMLLGLPGAAIGLFVMRYPFSLTAFIGITSLCGIVVRNGIILIDYLQELRTLHGMGIQEAALAAAKRRMRPIFLTSAAASVGVIPMILSRSPLWGPLGTVICFGLLISMVLTLFILPVLYTIIYRNEKKGKPKSKHIPYSNIKKITPLIMLFVVMGTFMSTGSHAQSRTLSIDSCKIYALKNNKTIKNADLEVKSALETKKSAFTNYFPKVSASGLAMRSADYLVKGTIPSMNLPVYDGNLANLATASQFAYVPEIPINALDYINMASVSVTQPLFAGGRIVNGNKLAKIGSEVSQQKKLLNTTEVLVKTENLYWSTIALQDKMVTLTSYEKLLNQLLSDVSVSVKAGLAQRSDLLKVQLKLNEVGMNKLKLKNGISLSKEALCQHIGIDYDSTFVLIHPEVPTEFLQQSSTVDAAKDRYEYQMLNKALEAEKLQKKMTLGEYLPQVALGGIGFVNDVANKTSSNAMAFVSVSIPISDWWGGSHKLKESQFKIEQAANKLSETTELLNLQIQQAKNELNESRFQIKTSQASVDQSKENLKVVNDNYKAGVSSMSDLLEAQALYQDSQNQFTDAVCSYKIKMANYMQAIGRYK
ncbi:acriflavin resistance protein [Paludibacter propionicigenes WB4]|uniref:Acriflavin resistance protein n=1 Tax=Paludibacter propionicigenes (strain DSM 17365 / JCM 13257 / WB4) TaxID=694427 RepID=E4T753_PALPW|nr:efflux RND transporter permease subunit [Paludibacter propionicigenes]ADQ80547.1 acriflavin resistance protein [Paludibacter propionicigenes WB4]